jgi:hypothetical protein
LHLLQPATVSSAVFTDFFLLYKTIPAAFAPHILAQNVHFDILWCK